MQIKAYENPRKRSSGGQQLSKETHFFFSFHLKEYDNDHKNNNIIDNTNKNKKNIITTIKKL